eukprot:c19027_g1_i1 orf=167-1585(+)
MDDHSNLYREQHHHHVQAWDSSAMEAQVAASRNLMAALQGSHDFYKSRSPDVQHLRQAEGHVLSPKRPFIQDSMHTHEGSAAGGGAVIGANSTRSISDDVVFYVGKSRHAYHVNAQSLIKGSAYFRNLLQYGDPAPQMGKQMAGPPPQRGSNGGPYCPPIVMDCEEGIFESLLLLMRYGTLEALPPMTAAETFKVKKEAQFYGIHYTEQMLKSKAAQSGDDRSDMSSTSPSSSPSGSPKSMMNVSPRAGRGSSKCASGRYHDGVQVACSTSRHLAELPEFPLDLADPARLVLVSCLDQEKASIYTCECATASSRIPASSPTQWAVNFHHRHAFCTACGRTPNMSSKHFTEMFMAVAAHYHAAASPNQAPIKPNSAWRVSGDSTCMLRFVGSAGDGPDACGCSASGARAEEEVPPTIWAGSCFYSHAFCTRCGEPAPGPVLLSVILALRYGGSNKAGRSSFRIPTVPSRSRLS